MGKLNNIVFFASNDGGHFAQLMALQDLFGKYVSVIITDNERADKNVAALRHVRAIEFAMAFADRRKELSRGKRGKITRFSYLISYCNSFKQCHAIWNKYRPKVIISTGSNIAVPLCFIAKMHGTRFVYIETRAKVYNKTISGRIVEHFADKIIVQWPEMVDVYKGKAEYYGTLV